MNAQTNTEQKLKEKLAAIEHERWADWQKWMHKRMKPHDDPMRGEMCMDEEDYERWERQIKTPYAELSDEEKASDMEQVDRYWPLITALIEQKQIEAREQTAQTILEHLQSRPIHEHIEYLEAEIMMMEAANAKAKV